MIEDAAKSEKADREQLRLLAIFHYIVGGMLLLFSSLGLIYVVLGVLMATRPDIFQHAAEDRGPPPLLGVLFAGMGTFFVLSGWTVGILTMISGRSLQRLRWRTLSLVMAAMNCLWVPFGTILGVFTLVVLLRPSVVNLYEGQGETPTSAEMMP